MRKEGVWPLLEAINCGAVFFIRVSTQFLGHSGNVSVCDGIPVASFKLDPRSGTGNSGITMRVT